MSRKCLFPFTNLAISPNGSGSPCCKYNLNKTDGNIEGQTLYDNNVKELFFQPAMENIRKQFNEGIEPEACQVCWDEEAAGLTSMRQHKFNLAKWNRHKEKYVGRFEDPQIVTLDFKFSSLCNLKCRICGPYCSSNWLKESLDTGDYHEHTIKIFSKYAERKFVNNEVNFEIFNEILPNLHILEFYGGEPLMQPEHTRIMNILNSYPDVEKLNLELFYNTNGTIYDDSIIETWNKMGLVELNISLDDIEDRFEYQRYPAKWNDVLNNIKLYKDHCNSNVKIHLYCTVSLYNIFYIDDLIKYNAENLKLPLRFNLLHWPESMSIKHLPEFVKNIIKSKIDLLTVDELSYVSKGFGVSGIVNFMMNTSSSSEELDKFFKTTETHDVYRNHKFQETFLEYWILLNETN
jgi:molybdenum cofactor biosynthesis enzyme MoaA